MYTQCPECDTAFRITQAVLQQAGGKVRCGRCGAVFNALQWLSEDLPGAGEEASERDEAGALLKRLEELAGTDDIRIEDTGVEWRVIEDDEFLPDDEAEGEPAAEEQRYDDNTPLPDELLDEAEEPASPPREEIVVVPSPPEPDEERADLALDDAGGWLELLEEVGIEEAEPPLELTLEEQEPTTGPGLEEPEPELSIEEQEPPIEAGIGERKRPSEAGDEAQELLIEPGMEIAGDYCLEEGLEEHIEEDAAYGTATPELHEAAAEAAAEPARPEPASGDGEEDLDWLIDRDLLRYTEEQDALGSEDREADDAAVAEGQQEAPLFETIIMEGESVRRETPAAEEAADAVRPETKEAAPHAPPAPAAAADDARRFRVDVDGRAVATVAVVAVLALTLLAQVVHAHRQAIATNDAFGGAVDVLYRMAGVTIVPEWNVRGWQFLSTRGRTDDATNELSVASRLVNGSGRPLPYPLMHLSLTDRWEEVVGSSVIDPARYLAAGGNHAARVAPGEGFEARISIPSLPPEATGFKLNVCYRANAGKLRCAIEDFRN